MQTLSEYLKNVSSLSCPDLWTSRTVLIEKENRHLLRLLDTGSITIYGTNSLTGHRDSEHITSSEISSFQENILQTHAIGGPPWYSNYVARCITYAKLYSWSMGMSGISPDLYNSVISLANAPDFNPRIPKNCSYSSGDVIPAAHWAREVLLELKQSKQYNPQPGEVMAMINGSFVHVGYAASLIKKIQKSWVFFIEVSALCNAACQANSSNLSFFPKATKTWVRATIEYLKAQTHNKFIAKDAQDPVSLRALPQILDVLCKSIEEYMLEIDHALSQPSGNPLFNTDIDHPLSQASFLSPVLTVKSGAIIESILFAMWSMIGWTNHLLSGKVSGIPKDASNNDSILGLIQFPKLMMATLEKARTQNGRRIFASGSQTSYGVEDLWSNGVIVTEQIEDLLHEFNYLCSVELYVISYIEKNFHLNLQNRNGFIEIGQESNNPTDIMNRVSRFLDEGGAKELVDLFPVTV